MAGLGSRWRLLLGLLRRLLHRNALGAVVLEVLLELLLVWLRRWNLDLHWNLRVLRRVVALRGNERMWWHRLIAGVHWLLITTRLLLGRIVVWRRRWVLELRWS